MIGHRGEGFKSLYREIHPLLQGLFGTKQPVFLSTSSAWGVMEAAIRNVVRERVLCCMCGAFSDKWLDVARRCGKEAEALQVEWGKHIDQRAIDRELASGKFDAITLIHNETSTGVMNPLPEICCTLAKYPDVVLILDTVSSFSAMKIDMDALGIDVMLTGAQKALALPPGFSLFSVSEKAFARAERQKHRRCRSCEAFARETSSCHRPRLRQTPRQNLSPLQHGRRNRRNSVTSAQFFERLPLRITWRRLKNTLKKMRAAISAFTLS